MITNWGWMFSARHYCGEQSLLLSKVIEMKKRRDDKSVSHLKKLTYSSNNSFYTMITNCRRRPAAKDKGCQHCGEQSLLLSSHWNEELWRAADEDKGSQHCGEQSPLFIGGYYPFKGSQDVDSMWGAITVVVKSWTVVAVSSLFCPLIISDCVFL